MKKTQIFVITAVILILLILTGAWYAVSPGPGKGSAPDPGAQSSEEHVAFIASATFEDLPLEKRASYVKKVREIRRDEREENAVQSGAVPSRETLGEEERRRLRRNIRTVRREQMDKRLNEFYELPSAERTAYMDQIIDQMAERRRERSEQRAGSARANAGRDTQRGPRNGANAERSGRRRGPSLTRVRDRIEKTDPEDRARRMAFISAMRKRMEERGIDMPFRRRSRR